MPSYCSVAGCGMRRRISLVKGLPISYFRLPHDESLRQLWINICKISSKAQIKYIEVCSQHFRAEDFERDLRAELLNLKPRVMLKRNAVPTLKLPCDNEYQECEIPLKNAHNMNLFEDTVCAVSCCDGSAKYAKSHHIKLWFYPFPEASNMRKQWVERCNPCSTPFDVTTAKVCSRHFTEEDFEEDVKGARLLKKQPKLKKTAVPSLLLETDVNKESFMLAPVEEIYIPKCPANSESENADSPVDPAEQKSAKCDVECSETDIHIPQLETDIQIPERRNAQTSKEFDVFASELNQGTLPLTEDKVRVICRTCLSKRGDVSLYETTFLRKDLYYFDILETVAGTKVNRECPMKICKACVTSLTKSYMFKKQIERSEHALKKFKEDLEQPNKTIKIDVTDQISDHDYASSDLKSPNIQENPPKAVNVVPTQPIILNTLFFLNSSAITNLPLIHNNQPNSLKKITENVIKSPEIRTITNIPLIHDNRQNSLKDIPENVIKSTEIRTITNLRKDIPENVKKSTEIRTNIKKNKKTLKVKSTVSGYEKKKLIRQAYKLIATGNIDQGKKLLTDKNVTFPPLICEALNPSPCRVCGVHFENEYEYKKHAKLTKHYRTPYPCDHCPKVFPTWQLLHNHRNGRLKLSKLCEKCGTSFTSNAGLMQHVKRTHGEGKYTCKVCGLALQNLSSFARHRWRVHRENFKGGQDPTKMEICDICGAKLASKHTLRVHRNSVHLKILPHACNLCDAKFSNRTLLRYHQSAHSTETFDCGFCNTVLKDRKKFVNHRLKFHAVLPFDADVVTEFVPNECTFCQTKCPNLQALSVHLKDHRIDACVYCDDIFKDAENLTSHHKKLHEEVPEWMCRYCNKTYEDGKGLFAHLALHKCKSFKCDKCPKMYDSSNKLKRHKLLHDGVKNHACRFCPKRFSSQSTLVVHERIHTGERPYKCDVCGSCHICAGSLSKHRQKHFEPVEEVKNEGLILDGC